MPAVICSGEVLLDYEVRDEWPAVAGIAEDVPRRAGQTEYQNAIVERLAGEVAELAHETKTEAIRLALV